ncbi:MAG: class I SAM-dependent rRNA methyltransferase [Firmicutes bacterium]|nr:class I SAM-dependent rRNA methyltransferase [Candidatus Fermentithermobacillaceae bacterium]
MRARVELKPGQKHRAITGHPWVFQTEVCSVEGSFQPGDIVDVVDSKGRFIGRGYINPASQILVRILTREDEDINEEFIMRRFEAAVLFRKQIYEDNWPPERSGIGTRLVFSEADFLPGLIVDDFGGYVVFQTLTLGMDRWKDVVIRAIADLLAPKGIYERNDAPVRSLEGLPQVAGFVGRPFDPLVEIDENGVRHLVDVAKGQKTGYFLDQKENRLAVRWLAKDKKVLDAFSYSGGFSLSLAKGGAVHVTAIDVSEAALDLFQASAKLNRLDTEFQLRAANAFDELRDYDRRGEFFDVVVLDPPAFARSRRAVPRALAGYKEINLRAIKVVRPGGFLITSSCSQHLFPTEFESVIEDAAHDAGRVLRLLERRGQARDHPVLVGVPETEYLKCRIYQVL